MPAKFACFLFFLVFSTPAFADYGLCFSGSSNVAFGTLGVTSFTGATTAGAWSETCPLALGLGSGVALCPSIGAGNNSVSQSNRTMTLGGNSISYQLYSDSAYSVAFQYVGSDVVHESYNSLIGSSWNAPIYAEILSSTAGLPPGAYTDTYTSSSQGAITVDGAPNYVVSHECVGNSGSQWWNTLSFTVSVTLQASCTISAGAMSFGSLASNISANVHTTATITALCTSTTPYSVGLGLGNYASGSQRRMNLPSTSNYVNYALYTDAAYSLVWGTTTAAGSCTSGSGTCFLGTGNGSNQTITIYGQLPPQTVNATGTYGDTVVVTLTY
jgi:spore coat protein U-like protein